MKRLSSLFDYTREKFALSLSFRAGKLLFSIVYNAKTIALPAGRIVPGIIQRLSADFKTDGSVVYLLDSNR